MPEAARLGDLIGHAPPIPPVVAAAVAGGAVASGAAGTVGGGLTSAAHAGADAASGASGGGGSGVGGVVTGKIIGPCSGNVFINGIPAARALVDQAICSLHPLVPLPIVSGSSNVFINCHFTRASRGFEIGTQLDEYAAFRREALFELGRRPTLLEKRIVVRKDPKRPFLYWKAGRWRATNYTERIWKLICILLSTTTRSKP